MEKIIETQTENTLSVSSFEKAVSSFIDEKFAMPDGRLNFAYKHAVKWSKEPEKYAMCIQMWEDVLMWVKQVWSVYGNYKFTGEFEDLNTLPNPPYTYYQIAFEEQNIDKNE